MEMLIQLAFPLSLLFLGFYFGSSTEKKHLKSIREREKRYANLPVYAIGKTADVSQFQESILVTGSVVVGQDYFKAFLAGLKNFFGGRVSSYETLLDRARREAILRLKEEALNWEAKSVVNLRLETSSIMKNSQKNSTGAVEIMAYATALK